VAKSQRPTPAASDAYAPRRSLVAGWPGTLVSVAVITAVVVVTVQRPELPNLLICGFVLVLGARTLLQGRKPGPPVVVDEPGITFSDTGDGGGPRLVAWESITTVVLFEIPRTDTSRRRWQPAIGVQLIGHPDGVSVHRPLTGWSLDRAALGRAVTRFGGGVQVVDGPRSTGEATAEQLHTEIRRMATEAMSTETPYGTPAETPSETPYETQAEAPYETQAETPARQAMDGQTPDGHAMDGQATRPRVQWHRTARYRPVDPAAYLARFDLRSNFGMIAALVAVQVFLWFIVVPQGPGVGITMAVVFALPLLYMWRTLRSGGAVALAVDQPGVFFGDSHSPGDDQEHRLVPWPDIGAVVVYDQLVDGSKEDKWERAVGVRLRGEPTLARHWRIVEGWQLDRPALEAAVTQFAPGIRVLDGPPQRPSNATDTLRAMYDVGREIYEDEHRRRED